MYLLLMIDLPSSTERELRMYLWTDLVEPSEQLISRFRNFPFSRNLTYRWSNSKSNAGGGGDAEWVAFLGLQ